MMFGENKNLPFRDQLAIMLFIDGIKSHNPLEDNIIVSSVQRFAESCCAGFGHDWRAHLPFEIGAATIAAKPSATVVHAQCARCGAFREPNERT